VLTGEAKWEMVEVSGIIPSGSPPPALFDLDDFDYAPLNEQPTDYQNICLRQFTINDPPPNTDNIAPSIGRPTMNNDGTWKVRLPDTSYYDWQLFDWVSSSGPIAENQWTYWFRENAQFQSKIRLTGPVKGTWLIWSEWTLEHAITGQWLALDPWPGLTEDFITMFAPESASYIELDAGEQMELVVPLPSGATNVNLGAFRYGKQPSDFSWYPLP
jgi:hypothetical protein